MRAAERMAQVITDIGLPIIASACMEALAPAGVMAVDAIRQFMAVARTRRVIGVTAGVNTTLAATSEHTGTGTSTTARAHAVIPEQPRGSQVTVLFGAVSLRPIRRGSVPAVLLSVAPASLRRAAGRRWRPGWRRRD